MRDSGVGFATADGRACSGFAPSAAAATTAPVSGCSSCRLMELAQGRVSAPGDPGRSQGARFDAHLACGPGRQRRECRGHPPRRASWWWRMTRTWRPGHREPARGRLRGGLTSEARHEQALALARRRRLLLIVLDVMLPVSTAGRVPQAARAGQYAGAVPHRARGPSRPRARPGSRRR